MTVEELREKARNIVAEILPDISSEDIADNTDIFSLGLDSINTMALVTNLQDSFDIQLETNEFNFENFQTIANIIDMIRRKKGL